MTHHLIAFLHHFGYAAVALFMIAEGCGIPVPAGTMLVIAAAAASRGTLSVWGVVLPAAAGGVVGGAAGYGIGEYGGLPLVRRYGGRIGIGKPKLDRARKFFTRRGGSAAFLGRFVPVLRPITPMIAGTTQMSFWRFNAANAAGSIASAALYGFLGYQFGRDLPALQHHLTLSIIALVALALVAAVIWISRTRRRNARK